MLNVHLIGDSLIFSPNNIIYNCVSGLFHPDVEDLFTARNLNPLLRMLEGRESGNGIIDPRPNSGSPVFENVDNLPEDGFFESVDFVGAFGEELWLKGWSWLDNARRLPAENSIDFEKEVFIDEFRILSIYPNPFNPTAKIKFKMDKQSFVVGEIFDLSGRLLKRVFSENYPRGIHIKSIEVDDLSSGIYIFRISNGHRYSFQKISIIK